MPVQRPQNRPSVGAAAAQARLGGDALGNPDGKSLGIPLGRLAKHLGGLPGQVGPVLGHILPVAGEGPGLPGPHLHLHIVPNGDGLHHRLQVMIAVRPLAQNVQRQIDFCKSALAQGLAHLIFLPSK